MIKPKRWLGSLEDAPEGAAKLLSAYSTPAPMPADVHARLLVKATQLSAIKPLGVAAALASKPAVVAIAIAVAGATAAATSRPVALAVTLQAPLERGLAPIAAIASLPPEPERSQPEAGGPVVAVEQLSPETPPKTRVHAKPHRASRRVGLLSEEVALVDQARGLLEQDPAAALRICREHENRFPDGQLRSTRDALAIRALKKLGRIDEAKKQAESLLERDPATLHADEAVDLVDEGRSDP